MSYVLTMFSKKEYSLTSLKQIIRDFSYNRALKLLFDTSARTYDYIFSSVEGMSGQLPLTCLVSCFRRERAYATGYSPW